MEEVKVVKKARKLVWGVGVSDANYIVSPVVVSK